jgi:hypothetical protein
LDLHSQPGKIDNHGRSAKPEVATLIRYPKLSGRSCHKCEQKNVVQMDTLSLQQSREQVLITLAIPVTESDPGDEP